MLGPGHGTHHWACAVSRHLPEGVCRPAVYIILVLSSSLRLFWYIDDFSPNKCWLVQVKTMWIVVVLTLLPHHTHPFTCAPFCLHLPITFTWHCAFLCPTTNDRPSNCPLLALASYPSMLATGPVARTQTWLTSASCPIHLLGGRAEKIAWLCVSLYLLLPNSPH